MTGQYQIAIIGAGPAGLSAAARAASQGLQYLLLEASSAIAKTIQDYQKGKHVMAEPGVLPLRSDLGFEVSTREQVLGTWEAGVQSLGMNIRYGAEVVRIGGSKGAFVLTLANGEILQAQHVVLGIGLQGNPRALGVAGEGPGCVQYTLADASAHRGETIVVVGAGDAAIENAVSLAAQNTVYLINRRDEFARAKEGNLALVLDAIERGRIRCYYSSVPLRIDASADATKPFVFTIKTRDGEAAIPCDRIIARLGAIPPREFVESCGIRFPNASPVAVPELSAQYQSNVPGLYVVGALAGCPLIKQAMNQGYEVVEHILGNPVQPADHPLLEQRLAVLPFGLEVDETLDLFRARIPMFRELTALQFRELMLDSKVIALGKNLKVGDALFKRGDYTNSFYTIVDGEVLVDIDAEGRQKRTLGSGQFLGEMSLLSGQRRDTTACAGRDCVLVETPRRTMVKLLNSNDSVRRGLDEVFIMRSLQANFAPDASFEQLAPIARTCEFKTCNRGEFLFQEGDSGEQMYLIRSGSVILSRVSDGRELVFAQVPSGQYVGEAALMGNPVRMASAQAAVFTETIAIHRDSFRALINLAPGLVNRIQERTRLRLVQDVSVEADPSSGAVMGFLMEQGLGESTDVLVIHEDLCVGCDNCEVACAETHGGVSRLDRAGGASFASVHVPVACRHCEFPHCMKDCPPDAIHRAPSGEVFIDDTCIGCENCVRNCPYGVISMAYPAPPKPGLFSWLLFGAGSGPGQHHDSSHSTDKRALKKAVKCDACKDLPQGPACVRACPTGAAVRLEPQRFSDLLARNADPLARNADPRNVDPRNKGGR
jgi:CRP-like cAMP-binding protein/Fe-S-cluster-containing hydrogenase component 2/thioredoxin reductase